MNWLELVLWSQAPVVFIAVWIYYKDKYEKEPWYLLALCFFMGIICAFFAGITNGMLFKLFDVKLGEDYLKLFFAAFFMVGLFEEGFKFICLRSLFKNKNFNEPFDGIIYGAFIGLGFASIENMDYVNRGGASTAIARMFTAVPLHASMGMILGYYFGKAKFHVRQKDISKVLFKGFVLVILIHGTYDYFLFLRSKSAIILITFSVFIYTIILSRKLIKKHQSDSPFKPKD